MPQHQSRRIGPRPGRTDIWRIALRAFPRPAAAGRAAAGSSPSRWRNWLSWPVRRGGYSRRQADRRQLRWPWSHESQHRPAGRVANGRSGRHRSHPHWHAAREGAVQPDEWAGQNDQRNRHCRQALLRKVGEPTGRTGHHEARGGARGASEASAGGSTPPSMPFARHHPTGRAAIPCTTPHRDAVSARLVFGKAHRTRRRDRVRRRPGQISSPPSPATSGASRPWRGRSARPGGCATGGREALQCEDPPHRRRPLPPGHLAHHLACAAPPSYPPGRDSAVTPPPRRSMSRTLVTRRLLLWPTRPRGCAGRRDNRRPVRQFWLRDGRS